MTYVFQFSVIADNWLPLLRGAWLTMRLTAMSVVLGTGLAVGCAYVSLHGGRWLRAIVRAYVEAIRNTPLLASCSSCSSACRSWACGCRPIRRRSSA